MLRPCQQRSARRPTTRRAVIQPRRAPQGQRRCWQLASDGFEWRDRYQYAQGELALFCGGRQVAALMRRGAGAWFSRLWSHWPIDTPLVLRDCSSFEAGKAGLEAWADRNQAHIREEIATGVVRRPPGA